LKTLALQKNAPTTLAGIAREKGVFRKSTIATQKKSRRGVELGEEKKEWGKGPRRGLLGLPLTETIEDGEEVKCQTACLGRKKKKKGTDPRWRGEKEGGRFSEIFGGAVRQIERKNNNERKKRD